MSYLISEIVELELQARKAFDLQLISIIESRYQKGTGAVKRGELQQYLYNDLGFHGRKSDQFCSYINKLLVEQGFRNSYLRGERVVYGLIPKADLDLKLKISLVPVYYKKIYSNLDSKLDEPKENP